MAWFWKSFDKNQKNAAIWLVDMKKLSKPLNDEIDVLNSVITNLCCLNFAVNWVREYTFVVSTLSNLCSYDQNPTESQCSMGLRMKIYDKKNEVKRFYQVIGRKKVWICDDWRGKGHYAKS
jgi:hypothetical protein